MKYTKVAILIVIITSLFFYYKNYSKENNLINHIELKANDIINKSDKVFKAIPILTKANKAKKFCLENELNTDFCILIDMSIHSGKNRLFVYNFKTDSIINTALCAHGCCDNEWSADSTKTAPYFSNIPDSHCSSIGKYKIGKRGYSNWGININYRLHGLESTNSNAYSRAIVLHSWDIIAEKETYPTGSPEGWGCPAVSNNFMRKLDSLIKDEQKSILLWIYNK